jgi:hypothetical protein
MQGLRAVNAKSYVDSSQPIGQPVGSPQQQRILDSNL